MTILDISMSLKPYGIRAFPRWLSLLSARGLNLDAHPDNRCIIRHWKSTLSDGSQSLRGLDSRLAKEAEAHYRSLIEYRPKTELGRRLWNLRLENIQSGARLLSWEEIEREKAAWRGEVSWGNDEN